MNVALSIGLFTVGVVIGSLVANLIFYRRAGHGLFTVNTNTSDGKDQYHLMLTTPTDELYKCTKLIFKVVKMTTDEWKEN